MQLAMFIEARLVSPALSVAASKYSTQQFFPDPAQRLARSPWAVAELIRGYDMDLKEDWAFCSTWKLSTVCFAKLQIFPH